ncbi:hypothetical protein BaOVIS_009230 [Babesia ovis]|uniref:Uncharacterized protein n=1 Tax=Babesia ovis TaxID=5869 RepID=A0A9W5WU61_BABOV|nr:hypothetical protein BaOVIS_009230 [Babesia ovis]
MEYDIDGTQTTCLSSALENCLSKCRHSLHDDALIEHYESVYQNNLFQYNKILALLTCTIDDCEANARCISYAIENDAGIRDGIQNEIEVLIEKSAVAKERIQQLNEERVVAIEVLEGRIKWETELEQSLEQKTQEAKAVETQITLCYFANQQIKSSVQNNDKRIRAINECSNHERCCVVARQNAYRMMMAEIYDKQVMHQRRVEDIVRIHGEMEQGKNKLVEEHTSILNKLEEMKCCINNVKTAKDSCQETLFEVEQEINDRGLGIMGLREEIAQLEKEISMSISKLDEACAEQQRLSKTEVNMSSKVNELQRDVEMLETNKRELQSKIETQSPRIKELENILNVKKQELEIKQIERSKSYRKYNILLMQLEEVTTDFETKSKGHLETIVQIGSRRNFPGNNPNPDDIRKMAYEMQRQLNQLQKLESKTSEEITKASMELSDLKQSQMALTKQVETAEITCAMLNKEIASLREQVNHITSKDDDRKKMIADLIKEQEYIGKMIDDLKVEEEKVKNDYNKQIQDQIEAHKLKLKFLKTDNCSDLSEIIEEEKRNSDILLNAAIEALELEYAKEKSKLESEHNAMIKEEKEKYEAIRKVNISEIERLRTSIRECKPKEPVIASAIPQLPPPVPRKIFPTEPIKLVYVVDSHISVGTLNQRPIV